MTTETNQLDLTRTYTAKEFEALPDDGNRYELIEGKLVMSPPAGGRHGRVSKSLLKAIWAFDPEEKLGESWVTTGFNLDSGNTPEPDIAYVVASRTPTIDDDAVDIVPDLAVEVWSPSQLTNKGPVLKATDKIERYLASGVRIIWSINPRAKTVEIYHQGQSAPIAVLGVNDELDGEDVIPGFRLKVSKLFE